jgi:hypothetical protein
MGHGNIKTFFHRFNISGERTCPCGEGEQTTDHIIYGCARLNEGKDRLREEVNRTEGWPILKRFLLKGQYKEFLNLSIPYHLK